MILVRTFTGSNLPTVQTITKAELVCLAVRAAYPAMLPPAISFPGLADLLAQGEPPAFAFLTVGDAAAWAASYAGPQSALIRFLVVDFAATVRDEPAAPVDALLYGG